MVRSHRLLPVVMAVAAFLTAPGAPVWGSGSDVLELPYTAGGGGVTPGQGLNFHSGSSLPPSAGGGASPWTPFPPLPPSPLRANSPENQGFQNLFSFGQFFPPAPSVHL